jgi:hypothetical protein
MCSSRQWDRGWRGCSAEQWRAIVRPVRLRLRSRLPLHPGAGVSARCRKGGRLTRSLATRFGVRSLDENSGSGQRGVLDPVRVGSGPVMGYCSGRLVEPGKRVPHSCCGLLDRDHLCLVCSPGFTPCAVNGGTEGREGGGGRALCRTCTGRGSVPVRWRSLRGCCSSGCAGLNSAARRAYAEISTEHVSGGHSPNVGRRPRGTRVVLEHWVESGDSGSVLLSLRSIWSEVLPSARAGRLLESC